MDILTNYKTEQDYLKDNDFILYVFGVADDTNKWVKLYQDKELSGPALKARQTLLLPLDTESGVDDSEKKDLKNRILISVKR